MCAFVVLGVVFPYQAKRLAWGTSSKWPILCQVGRKTLISQPAPAWRNIVEEGWLKNKSLATPGVTNHDMARAGHRISIIDVTDVDFLSNSMDIYCGGSVIPLTDLNIYGNPQNKN